MDLLSKSSKARLLDLRRMAASVPLPAPPKDSPPVFVMGGADDFVVDEARGGGAVVPSFFVSCGRTPRSQQPF